ncbi:MAG: type II toxin-antitoxin system RatA family toxin [Gammaproteobacteria bacterium]|nr:type II toxin-antitoxin system RatA family toxin [Gammaproteobacteria bacterium]
MTRIDRSALVSYSAQQMFELVNDIENYPLFMQGCTAARIISASKDELVGELTLSKAGISRTFTTRNVLTPGVEMSMELVKGTFSVFNATWRFNSLTEEACKVSLEMEFEFSNALMDLTLNKMFSSSANNLVDALVKRAHLVYGA